MGGRKNEFIRIRACQFTHQLRGSNRFLDLLPLNNLISVRREFLKIAIRELQEATGCAGTIDFVFAAGQYVLAAVCLKERKVAAYRYQGGRRLCSLYTSNTAGCGLTWSVLGKQRSGAGKLLKPDVFSLCADKGKSGSKIL